MMLLDSNIIIYATRPEYAWLREFIANHDSAVSALSYVETLGYHRLTEMERQLLDEFFAVALVLPISQPVLNQAVALRQMRRMTVGDAIIAGTALTHNLILVTRNVNDFQWIEELQLLNPFER
ncbi:MAG: type II toxin-antitoxin system VapC family toxin [Coleofasciculus chthonoplastes F1-TOW-03]